MSEAAAQLPEIQSIPVLGSATAVPPRPYLLGPSLDVLMIGGASLVAFLIAWLIVDKSASTSQISWTAFYLAMAVNNPHFAASYMLLYWDKRRELFKKRSFIWAAFIAPVLIGVYLTACIVTADTRLLGYSVNLMFFLVGWHYVKQIYGTILAVGRRRGYVLTRRESLLLRLNLYPVWFMSYLNGNAGIRHLLSYGVGYETFALPEPVAWVNYGALAISLVAVAWLAYRKWVREGLLPGWTATTAFAAIYVWYLPGIYHPHFFYLIPFFHSLQYMLFVVTLKKNEYKAGAQAAESLPERQRAWLAGRFLGFMALITVLGFAMFQWVPGWLDGAVAYDTKTFGPQLFTFAFITFINIHHYVVDNVLWRRDNKNLRHLYA